MVTDVQPSPARGRRRGRGRVDLVVIDTPAPVRDGRPAAQRERDDAVPPAPASPRPARRRPALEALDPLEGDRTMGKLIDAVVIYLPRYLADFGSLFLGPKRFIAQKNTRAKDTFGESLVFLVVSQFLTVVMTAPLARPGISLSVRLMASAVVALLGTALSAIALRFAWRLVGGRATVRSFFVTYAYFASVIAVVLTLILAPG